MTTIYIDGLRLEKTCSACPEQYEVFEGESQVAYLRLRHGEFRADVPSCGGHTVYYTTSMRGDGSFEPDERDFFLNAAIASVRRWMQLSDNQRSQVIDDTRIAVMAFIRCQTKE